MRKEGLFRKAVRITMATAAIWYGHHLYKSPEPQRAWDALTKEPQTCEQIMPNLQPADVIAVFGAGQDGNEPNTFQIERTEAAAALYVHGYSDNIVFVGSGNNALQASLTDYTIDYVQSLSGGSITITPENIYFIEDSINTAKNVKDFKKKMKERGWNMALAVTNFFHGPRVFVLGANNDVNLQVAPSECVGMVYYPDRSPDPIKRVSSENMQEMIQKENTALFFITFIDNNGDLSILRKDIMEYFGMLENK